MSKSKVEPPTLGCEKCNNTGTIVVVVGTETRGQSCECLQRVRLFEYLGDQLYAAPEWRYSALYNEQADRTKDSLFLRGKGPLARAHIRWVLRHKFQHTNGKFRYLIATDERLKNVFVGDESYSQMNPEDRGSRRTYNNLASVVQPPDLLIIELGRLRGRHGGGPKAFLNAIAGRGAAKPTWVIEGDVLFTVGHTAYSEEAADHLREHFEEVPLGGASAATPNPPAERERDRARSSFEPPDRKKSSWGKKKKSGGLAELSLDGMPDTEEE